MKVLRQYFDIFGRKSARDTFWTIGVLAGMGLLESIGILMIFPFLTMVSSHLGSHSSPVITEAVTRFAGNANPLYFTGSIALAAVVLSGLYKLFAYKQISNFVSRNRHTIGERLFRAYVFAGVDRFVDKPTSDMLKNVISEVDLAVTNVIKPAITALAYLFVAIFILAIIFVVDPRVAVFGTVIMGFSYLAIFGGARKVLTRIGNARSVILRSRASIAANAFNAMRDILVYSQRDRVMQRFNEQSDRFGDIQGRAEFISESPRIFVEAVAIGGMIAAVMVLVNLGSGDKGLLAMVGLYAFAAYKLMPALQHVYSNVSKARYSLPGLVAILSDIGRFENLTTTSRAGEQVSGPGVPPAFRRLQLRKVSYAVDISATTTGDKSGTKVIIRDVEFELGMGDIVALVGPSGAGKSTVADVIIGAKEPFSGAVAIDGQDLRSAQQWHDFRSSIGYVSQQVYLSNASLLENITFQSSIESTDRQALEDALRLSALSDYVTGLPAGLSTVLSDRGEGVSGGQRQRIGLARALYRRPRLLVLDEPTSALDEATERQVVEALQEVSAHCAIFMIAHRPQPIEAATMIIHMQDGTVRAIERRGVAELTTA